MQGQIQNRTTILWLLVHRIFTFLCYIACLPILGYALTDGRYFQGTESQKSEAAVQPENKDNENSAPQRTQILLRDIHVYRSIIDPKVVADIFGRRIAHRFIVIQVTIANQNSDYQFLIHDVLVNLGKVFPDCRLGCKPNVTSIELSLLRGVAERGQVTDPRNSILRIMRGTGTIAAGLIGVMDFGHSYSPGVAAFNGPALTAYTEAFPDSTINQMNRLNDSAYAANTVIPKQQAKVVAVFMPQSIILNESQQHAFWKDPTRLWENTCGSNTTGPKPSGGDGKCVEARDLRKLEVSVDGNFITEVTEKQPSVTAVIIDPDEMAKFQDDKPVVKGYILGQSLAGATLALKNQGLSIGVEGTTEENRVNFKITSDKPVASGTVLQFEVKNKQGSQVSSTVVAYHPQAPTLKGVDPPSVPSDAQKQEFTFSGSNFVPDYTSVLSTGTCGDMGPDAVTFVDSKTIKAEMTFPKDMKAGECDLRIVTPGGNSGPIKLQVTAPAKPNK